MKGSNVLFKSLSVEWSTPQNIFDELMKEFSFDLDVAATQDNAKCAKYYTTEIDGLSQEWKGTVWMNPPYGNNIKYWVKKAYQSNATVVGLLPSRTDTAWFHDYILGKSEIRFLRGRLKFEGGSSGTCSGRATFPSMVVIWRK